MNRKHEKPQDLTLFCPECDYNLTGATGDRCPWCGWEIDVDALVAQASQGLFGRRIGAVIACAVLGIGSLIAVTALAAATGRLGLQDRVVVAGVLVAAIGHLALGILLLVNRRWPLRHREAAAMLRLAGWGSIAAGVIGATGMLQASPQSRLVRGVPVNEAFEFVLAAFLYCLPGATLLIMRLVTFRTAERTAATTSIHTPNRDATLTQAPYIVELAGRFDRTRTSQSWTDSKGPVTPAIESLIARTWEREENLAREQNRILYDGDLVRLIHATKIGDRLHLELGPTRYRDFIGTHLRNVDEVAAAGREFLANALGVSAAVITHDGYLALGRRSGRVAYHAGRFHPFGGMVDAQDRPARRPDVFDALGRELDEELSIHPHEIADVMLTGLVRDRTLRQPELLFDVSVKFTRDGLQAVFDPTLGDGEHTAIEFVHDDPDAVLAFVSSTPAVTPVAEAVLMVHGLNTWGHDWYEQTCLLRYGEVPPSHA